MDDSTRAVRDFLFSMQPVREALGDFLPDLYKRAKVKYVTVYDPKPYPSSDFGISIELHNGAVVDFWIELNARDAWWELTYSVQRHNPDEDGSHSEADFPPRKVESATELPRFIVAAIQELRQKSSDDTLFR